MSTGSSSRRLLTAAAAAATLLGLNHGFSQAQGLRLRSLSIPRDIQPGRWVSFQVKVQSQNRAPREFLQKLAVVAGEGAGDESGVWVELKTVEAGKARIERGFFGHVSDTGNEESTDGAPATSPGKSGGSAASRLLRYQVLTPDGKLYEYPAGSEGAAARSDEDISAMNLLDFQPARPADRDSLGPDTLLIGRRVVPCRVYRVRRYGAEDWSDEDTAFVNRAVMTRSYWRNPTIPVTGFARTILEVSTERVRAASQAAAPSDSVASGTTAGDSSSAGSETPPSATGETQAPATGETPPSATGATGPGTGETPVPVRVIYRAEVTLLDLGDGAVPEVTQEPEPAPEEAVPAGPGGER